MRALGLSDAGRSASHEGSFHRGAADKGNPPRLDSTVLLPANKVLRKRIILVDRGVGLGQIEEVKGAKRLFRRDPDMENDMLEEKIDKLTAVMERVAVALESGASTGGAAAPAATGTKATGTKAAGTKATKPKTTADQLKAKFAELKARDDVGTGPLKEIISGQGCENLAELLVTPDKFDAAMAAMTTLEAEKDAEAASGGDDDEL